MAQDAVHAILQGFLPMLFGRGGLVSATEPALEFRETPRQSPESGQLRTCPEQAKQYKTQYEEDCEACDNHRKDVWYMHGRPLGELHLSPKIQPNRRESGDSL